MPPIPVLLVSGFLGAGKTTLMRRLILDARGRGLRAAVIVNEFGAEDVDSNILRQADAELLAGIAGGCACCSGQDELTWALEELGARPESERPDVVLMETSGLADPILLLDVLTAAQLLPFLRLGAIVTVVDAADLVATNSDTESNAPVGPLSQRPPAIASLQGRQIELSDLLVLNKADLAPPADLAAAETTLAAINPRARIERAVQCKIEFDELWPQAMDASAAPGRNERRTAAAAGDDEERGHSHSQTFACPLPHPVDRATLEAVLQGLDENVWRAKGFLRLQGEPGLFLLQYTGGPGGSRYTIGPFYLPPSGPEPPGVLVFIGSALDKAKITRDFSRMILLY